MTTNLGFDKPLYMLSFDHRGLIAAKSKAEGTLTEEEAAEVASARAQLSSAKHVVYAGFKAALADGVPADKAGILVDEECGADILGSASGLGYLTACPAEQPGRDEFDFAFGEDFAKHIETFRPTFCKVQVSYNPGGDPDLNRRQAARLKRLSDYLHNESTSLFMLELRLPPDRAQLAKLKVDRDTYDTDIRPRLTVGAIQQLQAAQVEPDVWRIEGFDRREDYENVVAAARAKGRDKVSCVVLGNGKDDEKIRGRLKTAASVPGFIGFAMGRTIFSGPLYDWVAAVTTSKGAAAQIARRYREFASIFENASK